MDKYQIRITCIIKGVYQAFIQNIDSDAEFIRITTGEDQRIGEHTQNYIRDSWIISPLKRGGEAYHIGDFMPEYKGIKSRAWFAFDAVKRGKPNIVIERYFGYMPPKSKLRTQIGSNVYVDLQDRDSGDLLDTFIEKKRSNMKSEYKWFSDAYAAEYAKLNEDQKLSVILGTGEVGVLYTRELRWIERFLDSYNKGIKLVDIKRTADRLHYCSFLKDFGLKEPEGQQDTDLTMKDLYKCSIYHD